MRNSIKKLVLKGVFTCLMVCSLTALPVQAAVSSNTKDDNEWNLVFSDEFNDDTVNAQYWNRYPAAIDSEDYFFYGSTPETVVCPENVSVSDGSLHILAENNPIDLGDGVDHKYRTGILCSSEIKK